MSWYSSLVLCIWQLHHATVCILSSLEKNTFSLCLCMATVLYEEELYIYISPVRNLIKHFFWRVGCCALFSSSCAVQVQMSFQGYEYRKFGLFSFWMFCRVHLNSCYIKKKKKLWECTSVHASVVLANLTGLWATVLIVSRLFQAQHCLRICAVLHDK